MKKRQRRLGDVDEIVLSLYARSLTTGEISAPFHDIYGASVSKETVSRITDKVVAEMEEWSHRPLDPVYVAIFIDAIVVKVREGQVANRPVYAAIGVTLPSQSDLCAQVQEATQQLDVLDKSTALAQDRYDYYHNQPYMNEWEITSVALSGASTVAHGVALVGVLEPHTPVGHQPDLG